MRDILLSDPPPSYTEKSPKTRPRDYILYYIYIVNGERAIRLENSRAG